MNSGVGAYTAAVDIWSLGCIFAELLRREMHSAGALNKKLQVQPLFQFDDEFAVFQTPKTYEQIESDDSRRSMQLDKYFDTIGTPGWFDIESLPAEKWRRYLSKMTGRSGTLPQIFSGVDADALDLLTRMLAFDPRRRPTCEEIAHHAYFQKTFGGGGTPHENEAMLLEQQRRRRHQMATENVSKISLGDEQQPQQELVFTPISEAIPEISPRSRSQNKHKRFCDLRHPGDALAALERAFETASFQALHPRRSPRSVRLSRGWPARTQSGSTGFPDFGCCASPSARYVFPPRSPQPRTAAVRSLSSSGCGCSR